MKLTAAIAGIYTNALIKAKGYEGTFKIHGISFKYQQLEVMEVDTADHWDIDISDCQPLLTPLSKISDEDSVEVAKILGLSYSDTDENYYLDLAGMREYLSELFDGVNRFQDSYTFDKISKLIHYCQSHSIDIGHGYGSNHIPSLIAAGVAVEKK